MMMNKVKKIVKKFIPKRYRKSVIKWKILIFHGYAEKSYALEGEDIILRSKFGEKETAGFYVDVGAHHPKRFSNTYYFYKKGWRGINIDAMPGSMEAFNRIRRRDINLVIPISNAKETLVYYMFDEPALNGFSKKISEERDTQTAHTIIGKIKMETSTLAEVLDSHLPNHVKIDFLSVDTEGWDLNVLRSNNWGKYRPKVVLVESLDSSLSDLDHCEVYAFMVGKGYDLFAKTIRTMFFMNRG